MKHIFLKKTVTEKMIKINFFIFIGLHSLSQSQNRFMPNLPLGEYRIVFDKVYHCESTKNHSIKINFYFSKKTLSITEMKGNFTTLIPLDDTLTLDLNFASWGTTGGWKPNSYVLITKKACSNVRNLLGNAWFTIIKSSNISTDSCPIPKGTYYLTTGIDLKKLDDLNFPKVYFYGKYKMVARFKNEENKVVGCVVFEINLIRPWEKPI